MILLKSTADSSDRRKRGSRAGGLQILNKLEVKTLQGLKIQKGKWRADGKKAARDGENKTFCAGEQCTSEAFRSSEQKKAALKKEQLCERCVGSLL